MYFVKAYEYFSNKKPDMFLLKDYLDSFMSYKQYFVIKHVQIKMLKFEHEKQKTYRISHSYYEM